MQTTIKTGVKPMLATPEITKPELVQFRAQDAAIAKLAEAYLPLRINGLDDKQGFVAVHDARMIVKNTRVAVEKKRKELKEDALRYGQAVDTEAKRLTALLAPIEDHLQAEEDAVVYERERIRRAADEAKQAKLQGRLDALRAVDVSAYYPGVVDAMSDAEFNAALAKATEAHAESKRVTAIAEQARQDELSAMAAERERLDAMRREQQAEADRLRIEREKIEAEQLAQRRAVELEQAKMEAAERARVETEQRIASQVAKEQAEREAAEAARIKADAERPQREKILAVANAVAVLKLSVPAGAGSRKVQAILSATSTSIRQVAGETLED